MIIESVNIRNFRKLQDSYIRFGKEQTIFVGANNSGKTSAMDAIAKFLNKKVFRFNDITICNLKEIDKIGEDWKLDNSTNLSIKNWLNFLPSMDLWLSVNEDEIRFVADLIPTLSWKSGFWGVRLIFQPGDLIGLRSDYLKAIQVANKNYGYIDAKTVKIFPESLSDFLKVKLNEYFKIKAYLLDPDKYSNNIPQDTDLEMECQTGTPFEHIIRVDYVGAQRDLSDPKESEFEKKSGSKLSNKIRQYYNRHFKVNDEISKEDVDILKASEISKKEFDKALNNKLKQIFEEVSGFGYPGLSDPKISVASEIETVDLLKHEAAVQYRIGDDESFKLPEKYNGLGYQNLLSIALDLIDFRDSWLKQRNESILSMESIEPVHLVLVEEPEAHLHVQVQQVFIKKAYSILTKNDTSIKNLSTQLIISTHSSHIAKEVDFCNLRYFKRLPATKHFEIPISCVENLSDIFANKDESQRFVAKYLQITHCDVFFADAVILVEGLAEQLLLPYFIKLNHPKLNEKFVSLLSVNGAYAFRFFKLFEKLGIPVLIITDLDSAICVNNKRKKALPCRNSGMVTTNITIKNILGVTLLDDLLDREIEKNVVGNGNVLIKYQQPIKIKEQELLTRTFEDSFILSNFNEFKQLKENECCVNLNKITEILNSKVDIDEVRGRIMKILNATSFKSSFSLDVIYCLSSNLLCNLVVPNYIDDGLIWLERKMGV